MTEVNEGDDKKQGTRVFKKSSHNGKITTYLCKRDFIDSLTHCDPIEGVVLVDPEYVRNRKVFTHVLAAFRYGREDLDVLGLTFRKDLYLASVQVYPGVSDNSNSNGTTTKPCSTLLNPPVVVATASPHKEAKSNSSYNNGNISDFTGEGVKDEESSDHVPLPLTRLQERLIKKLGSNAYPFYFKLPPDAPASVMLQPSQNESGKPCGVDYELRTYMADESDEKLQHRNSVRLAIRKLTYAPEKPAPQPSAIVVKDFLMSPGSLRLEVSLDKEKYYHGEWIGINVLVDNNSNKTVKKIRLSVVQVSDITLFSRATYRCTVDEAEFDESFPILPSQTGWCKVYQLRPLLANNRHKRGLALDGKLKHEDTNLASSTIICTPQQKECLGMIVQYRVKARLVLGFGASDVSVELPFTLTHPKPVPKLDENGAGIRAEEFDERLPVSAAPQPTVSAPTLDDLLLPELSAPPPVATGLPSRPPISTVPTPVAPVIGSSPWQSVLPSTVNVTTAGSPIADEDDLIFEDFARLRLQSATLTATDPNCG